MTETNLEVAETDAKKRTAQYMSVKEWVTRNQRTLIRQGAPVTMIATEYRNNGGGQNSDRMPYQGGKSNKKRQQDRRNGRNQSQPDRKPMTERCFCTLMNEKDVSQEYVHRNFDEMHNTISDRAIWPN